MSAAREAKLAEEARRRALLCEECVERRAVLLCRSCRDAARFCPQCWTHVHSTARRRLHEPVPIPSGGDGEEAATATATDLRVSISGGWGRCGMGGRRGIGVEETCVSVWRARVVGDGRNEEMTDVKVVGGCGRGWVVAGGWKGMGGGVVAGGWKGWVVGGGEWGARDSLHVLAPTSRSPPTPSPRRPP